MHRHLVLLLLLAGCLTTRVETMSHPTTVHLRLAQVCSDTIVERADGSAGYVPITVTDEKADVDVPGMRGGYSERNGKHSNVHDPMTYEVIRVRNGGTVVTELSLSDVEGLPKDSEGRAVVAVHCGT
jgi:hypothetical protein